MVPLIQRLVDLLRALQLGPRTFPDAIRDLLRALAAQGIQEDAAQAVVPGGQEWPGEALEALEHGAEEAARLNAAGLRLHLEVETLPLAKPGGHPTDRPATSYGPFVDSRTGHLLRFTAFESPALLTIIVRSFVSPDETVLLIPAESTPDTADLHRWTLPAGSVWIRSRFLVAGADNYTGLRIAGGTLEFAGNDAMARNPIQVFAPPSAPWTLSVVPEPADAPAAGSDGSTIAVTLPDRLVVHASGPAEVTGVVALSGFGSNITCDVAAGPPTIAADLCLFPLTARDENWTIAGNRSAAAQFDGGARITSPSWALPISPIGPLSIQVAPHGGSLAFGLSGDVKSTFAGLTGQPFTWFVSAMTANACRVEINGFQVTPGGRGDVELWSKARSTFTFAQLPLQRLLFRSARDGDDAVAVLGGHHRNQWDLPQQSDGTPFPFEGAIDTFGIIAFPEGMVLTCVSKGDGVALSRTAGLALENLYVVVHPPKRCGMVVAFVPEDATGAAGIAVFALDARFALPTLPDPYAANTRLIDRGDTFQEALRIGLEWVFGARPAVQVHLDGDLRFATPHPQRPAGEDAAEVPRRFHGFLDAFPEQVLLLDVSSREHLFGVALETPDEERPAIEDNRLAMPLNRVRLFMQPQVHWEPLWVEDDPTRVVQVLQAGLIQSVSNGGPTLIGARGNHAVATVPEAVSQQILAAIRDQRRAAALFSLPFGLHALAALSPNQDPQSPAVDTSVHEPDFGRLHSTLQLRLLARNMSPGDEDPSRVMPGQLKQLKNLDRSPLNPPLPGTNSVLSDLTDAFNGNFDGSLPLHRVDLSGYGLSTFSEWKLRDTDNGNGFIKVHFEVLNGRTAYEVIQVRTRLWECGPRVVRTFTMERRNSACTILSDSGWVAIEDGEFQQPKNTPFEKGMVRAFRRIRQITITGAPFELAPGFAVEPVTFNADVEIDSLDPNGKTTVPILKRPGYVHIPKNKGDDLTADHLRILFEKVGPITSPIDATVRVAETLRLHVTSVTSDFAPGPAPNTLGFAVAAVGGPQLPRAGQWSAVRIDPATAAAFPIDMQRGVPIVRAGNGPFMFREPSDARRVTATRPYGLLMSTQASRVLFPEPALKPAERGRLSFGAPSLADPYSLVQATSAFPTASAAIKLQEAATFAVLDEVWKIENTNFNVAPRATADLLKSAEWAFSRSYPNSPIHLDVDSLNPTSWKVAVPPTNLNLNLPDPLNDIFAIKAPYLAESGDLHALEKPTLEFKGALTELKKIVDALAHLIDVDLDVDVNVTAAGSGASPSFLVQLRLIFKLGTPAERIDIGVGKFFGQLLLEGNLEVGGSSVANVRRLFLEFQGDIQQGILPPLLYAGGLFRFGIEIPANGHPVIQLALGVVVSIGGDLIKGLLAVEVTIHYGYMLIPETLQPGMLLGLDARAKLLGGLVGFSFGVEAMARVERLDLDEGLTIWAHIRVAASVQIAWLIKEDIDFETQFEQTLPLELVTFAAGGGILGILPAVTRI